MRENTTPVENAELEHILQSWRANALNTLFTVVTVVITPALIAVLGRAFYKPQLLPVTLVYFFAYLCLVGLTVFRKLDFRLRSWSLIFLAYLTGVVAMALGGLAGDGRVWFLTMPMLALILIGVRAGVSMTILSLLTYFAFSFAAQSGLLENWLIVHDNSLAQLDWFLGGLVLAAALIAVMVLQSNFTNLLSVIATEKVMLHKQAEQEIVERKQAEKALEQARRKLEVLVNEQTAELAESNDNLQAEAIERIHAEDTLIKSEKLLRKIAENYPNSFLSIIEKDFTIGFTSGQEFKKQNLDPESFLGMSLDETFGDKSPFILNHYKKTFEGKERSFELYLNNQHQLYRTVPLYAKDGSIPQILVVVENITDRKRAESTARAYQDRFETFFSAIDDAIFVHPLLKEGHATFIEVNDVACKRYGYTRDEIFKLTPLDISKQENINKQIEPVRTHSQILLEKRHLVFETIHIKKTGEMFPVEISSSVIEQDGSPVVLSVARDISGRKQYEYEREKLVDDLAHRSMLLHTAAKVSKSVSEILALDELLQKTVEYIQGRFGYYYVGIFLLDRAKEFVKLKAGTGKAGKQMLENKHKLSLGGNSMVGWSVANAKARIALDVGREAVRFDNPLLPETRSEMALPLVSRTGALGALTVQSIEEAAFTEEDIAVLQTMADQLAIAIKNAQLYEQAQREINERKQVELELKKARNYIANIIDSMPSTLIGVDADGIITQWNSEAQRASGLLLVEALGQPLEQVFPRLSPELKRVRAAMRTRKVQTNPRKTYNENGETHYEDVTVYPLISNGIEGAVIRVDNITEQVRLEEMMIQSEKMLSVGGLAAGMAHEINNPLAGMIQTANNMTNRLTNTELTANQHAATEAGTTMEVISAFMEKRSIPRMINTINESGQRVAEIVDNMLSFARRSDSVASSLDIEELLDKALELASTDYDLTKQYDFRTIKIVKEYAQNLPLIPCEESKIQQVFLNLLRNGAQAMQGTKLMAAKGLNEKGEEFCFILRLEHEKKAGMLRIEFENNGPSMDESVRKRVFEPFFTTKPVGEGTGLGLSVSYFIVTENHGGAMEVISNPGEGVNFIIHLPVKRTGSNS